MALNGRGSGLLAGAVAVGGGQAAVPDVPWWGQLMMALVSVALAFFSGRERRS